MHRTAVSPGNTSTNAIMVSIGQAMSSRRNCLSRCRSLAAAGDGGSEALTLSEAGA